MKLFLAFIFLFLTTKIGLCNPVDSISEKLGGHIKEMRVYTISPKHDENGQALKGMPLDSSLSLIYRYDKAQHLLESVVGDGQGNVVERTTFKYNDKGLLSEEVHYSAEGLVRNKEIFKYDDHGKVLEHATYETGKEVESKIVYKYNKDGKKVSEITMKEDAGVINKKLFTYDAKGNLAGTREYDQKDTLITGYDYKYDGHDNKVEEVRFTNKGEEWKYVYTYTPFNMKEKEAHFSPFKTSNSTTVWLYDDAHNMTEEIIYDYKNKEIQKNIHKYEKGRLVADEANGAVTAFSYDAAGNKVKESISVLSGPSGKESRLISERSFDKKGNVVLWTHFNPPGIVSFIEFFEYNMSGKPVKYSKQYKDKTVIEQTEYLYDEKGNVLEEINKDGKQELVRKTATSYQYYE